MMIRLTESDHHTCLSERVREIKVCKLCLFLQKCLFVAGMKELM